MSHQQLSQTAPAVPAEAQPVLPFIANSHSKALERLIRTFKAGEPLAILIGRGKSATRFVTRSFFDNIEGDVDAVRITESGSDDNAAMHEIVNALGFDSKDMSDADLEDVLKMFLSLQTVRDRRTVICFEEAQNHGSWLPERVRRLVELEIEGNYGLMIILSGRPSLNRLLLEPPLNAVAAKAAQRITIAPFTPVDTKEYVRRQIETAGNPGIGYVFASDAIALIHELSEGVPDAVNNFYSRCLQLADEEDTISVTTDLVNRADTLIRQERAAQPSDTAPEAMKVNGAKPSNGRLIARINGDLVQEHNLKLGNNLIGRGKQCDIHLPSNRVSRRHALIVNTSDGAELVDLSSKNGTYVGGRPIKQYPLRDSDVISAGGCTIEYVAGNGHRA